jgi:hypothetical protein
LPFAIDSSLSTPVFSVTSTCVPPGRNVIAQGSTKVATGVAVKGSATGAARAAVLASVAPAPAAASAPGAVCALPPPPAEQAAASARTGSRKCLVCMIRLRNNGVIDQRDARIKVAAHPPAPA